MIAVILKMEIGGNFYFRIAWLNSSPTHIEIENPNSIDPQKFKVSRVTEKIGTGQVIVSIDPIHPMNIADNNDIEAMGFFTTIEQAKAVDETETK